MSGPPPFGSPQPAYPALYLYALNDSFVPKHIHLPHGQRVKIGRQTNAKTVPAERNGYFDSKVLSRQHAEVWEEGGKIYIKDVKSSNGTFINGERLSLEAVESEPYELKSDDIVEFGIDIVGEDNKTVMHHKVAARVVCIFTEADGHAALRAEQHSMPPPAASLATNGGAFNFAPSSTAPGSGPPPGAQNGISVGRRPTLQGMGGLGSMRPPGKSGLTFEHILNRLQGELQKSRETGAELHTLTGTINEVGDALGGGGPPSVQSYHPSNLPPVRPAQAQQQAEASTSSLGPSPSLPQGLNELQAQLRETQASLAAHVEKIRALEDSLVEHAAVKREVGALREMMEDRSRLLARPTSPNDMRMAPPEMRSGEFHHMDAEGDDDDARSVGTVVAHELERVEEEDEEQLRMEEAEQEREGQQEEEMVDELAEMEERQRRHDAMATRPRTPEPMGLGMDDEDVGPRGRSKTFTSRSGLSLSPPLSAATSEHGARLDALADQLQSALEMSRSLQNQQAEAQATIKDLEGKVTTLEALVRDSQLRQAEGSPPPAQEAELSSTAADKEEGLSEMLTEWKKNVEGQWAGVQEEWSAERERLKKATEEWETRVKVVEDGFGEAVRRVDDGLADLKSRTLAAVHLNGNATTTSPGHGLVTPPSPRSLSADSVRVRHRRRKSSAGRGRSRSRSPARSGTGSSGDSIGPGSGKDLSSSEHSYGQPIVGGLMASPHRQSKRNRSPWAAEDSSEDENDDEATKLGVGAREQDAAKYPTPKSSFTGTEPASPAATAHEGQTLKGLVPFTRAQYADLQNPQVSAALGVVMLSVAAAAVVWRIKPDAYT